MLHFPKNLPHQRESTAPASALLLQTEQLKIIIFSTLHDDFYIKIKRLNFEAYNQNKLSLYDKIILNKNRKYF